MGYDAGPSWSVETIGELDPCSFSAASTGITSGTTIKFYVPMTGSNVSLTSVGNAFTDVQLTINFFDSLPVEVKQHFNDENSN